MSVKENKNLWDLRLTIMESFGTYYFMLLCTQSQSAQNTHTLISGRPRNFVKGGIIFVEAKEHTKCTPGSVLNGIQNLGSVKHCDS